VRGRIDEGSPIFNDGWKLQIKGLASRNAANIRVFAVDVGDVIIPAAPLPGDIITVRIIKGIGGKSNARRIK